MILLNYKNYIDFSVLAHEDIDEVLNSDVALGPLSDTYTMRISADTFFAKMAQLRSYNYQNDIIETGTPRFFFAAERYSFEQLCSEITQLFKDPSSDIQPGSFYKESFYNFDVDSPDIIERKRRFNVSTRRRIREVREMNLDVYMQNFDAVFAKFDAAYKEAESVKERLIPLFKKFAQQNITEHDWKKFLVYCKHAKQRQKKFEAGKEVRLFDSTIQRLHDFADKQNVDVDVVEKAKQINLIVNRVLDDYYEIMSQEEADERRLIAKHITDEESLRIEREVDREFELGNDSVFHNYEE